MSSARSGLAMAPDRHQDEAEKRFPVAAELGDAQCDLVTAVRAPGKLVKRKIDIPLHAAAMQEMIEENPRRPAIAVIEGVAVEEKGIGDRRGEQGWVAPRAGKQQA